MLPPALLDLTLLRCSLPASQNVCRAARRIGVRAVHQVVQTSPLPPPPPCGLNSPARLRVHGSCDIVADVNDNWPALFHETKGSLTPGTEPEPSNSLSELEKKVKALEGVAAVETSATEEGPSLTEDDLLDLYEDIFALAQGTVNAPTRRDFDVETPEDPISKMMTVHAENGDVAAIENLMSSQLTAFPTERQRHLHIKAHLNATPSGTIPTSALQVLHSYETQSHPPAMRTYTSVITSLFASGASIGRAQAWDLFAHMRYVAHPSPDVPLYTLMIRACASPVNASRISSEPERALDLWTEMTMDRRLRPSSGAYDAIILACAKSGRKMFVNEAFRLAREMLDAHRDARGNMAYRPSRRTFCALLEGAKRVGDLARSRWILAEMISHRKTLGTEEAVENEGVNEEVMMHVFHAYAAYQPPFQRAAARGVQDSTLGEQESVATANAESSNDSRMNDPQNIEPLSPSFSHVPPQSRHEAILEVSVLFDRILHDTGRLQVDYVDKDGTLPTSGTFKDVELSSRLVNSYLSVYYKHASLTTARELYRALLGEYGVERTARTFVEALERCANAKKYGDERVVALEFAEEIWAQWREFEDTVKGTNARMIEKAYAAIIRVFSLTQNLDRAMQHLSEFVTRYPPSDIASTPQNSSPAFRATRTTLAGQRPLVRMIPSIEVPDDHVPPLFMFKDLEILHHRLVASGMAKEISYVKYVTKAYEGSLRMRRDKVMKGRAEKTKVPS